MSEQPVTIVTGAGGGIGRAVCVALAGAGHRLTLVGRTETTLEQTIEHLAAVVPDAPDTIVIPADLADDAQAASVVDMTVDRWGRVDAIVNNAAIAPMGPLADVDADVLSSAFAVNTFGPFHLVARAWPRFVEQGGGRVVNVSSLATIDPFPGLGVYAATKAALESLARSIVNEGGGAGIEAYSIAPGAVETPMLRTIVTEDDLPPDQTLDPADVAAVVAACVRGERPDDDGTVIVLHDRMTRA